MENGNKINIADLVKHTKKLKVLYVEDNHCVREKFATILENIFDLVEACECGEIACGLYKEKLHNSLPYDIVITDMCMPKVDGLELSQRILEQNPDQKILAISAYNDSETLEKIIDMGISNYIQKPVKKDRLFSVINKMAADISKQKKDEESKKLDPVTGIKNSQCLYEDVKSLSNEKNIIIVKLKNLDTIQTVYGIETADYFIKKLVFNFDDNKNLYRISTDKFAYLCARTLDLEGLIAQMIQFSKKCKFDIAIGASRENENLITTAEMALDFAIKESLGHKIYSKDIDLTSKYKNSIQLKSILNNAIEQDTVFPVFHPIYDKDKNIIKYEVLMRISNKENGKEHIYYPNEFMQISVESNKFNELSMITIKKAFNQMNKSTKSFSINISYEDVRNGILIEEIENQILEYEGIGERLIFEILETKNIEDYTLIADFIRKFKRYGVKIALDDFGAGYSNLNHIINFHSDYVKLDGTLIRNIKNDSRSLAVVKSVVSFTKELGIKTIAEFVSSKEIFDIVKEIEIDEFQGFYLSEPLREIAE